MPSRYAPGHEPTLRQVLHRLGLWPAADRPLPEPEDLRRGVAGHSAVYLVYLPSPSGGGRYLAAKFDRPARSRREWRAVAQLRALDAPPEILLPLPGNLPADGVMVFQAAEAVAGTLRCVTLQEYLIRQIATNPANCRTALAKTFEVLGAYYDIQPGAHRLDAGHGLLRWRDVYGDALRPATIRAIHATAARHWPGVDWEAAPTFPLAGPAGAGDRHLPNPLRRLPDLLLAPTGRIMLSRIHGDLNLSNVIVGERPDGGVDRVLVFDLANCEPGRAQAVDFARLEAEIWRRISGSAEVPVTEDELVAARDVLDGRIAEVPAGLSAVARGCVLLVDHLRELARARLEPRLPSAYLLADHFHALCLTALATLKHPDVAAGRSSSRTMLLAAALSLAFLDEVESGLYAPGSVVRRWPPPRRLAAPGAIETRDAPPSEEPPAARVPLASRRAREALDPYILERIMRPALVDKYLGAIARGLDGDRSRLIPLVGPAGFGKSTLLGTVYDRLTASAAGWCALLRCNDLDRTEIAGLSRSMGHALSGVAMPIEDLAASLSAARGMGVLLIDTLDLILDRETLPALRAIFTGLLDRRVTVFVTCRDYEYATLLEPVRDSLPGLVDALDRHQLPGFSPAEVEEATRSFFASRTDLAVRDGGRAFARRVLDLAADGRPMAEITRNPLLLALLCELFGREQHVPPDLTVSKLYDTFWSRKVAASRLHGRDAAEAFAKQEICQRLARDLALGAEAGLRDSMFSSDLHLAATPAGPAAFADLLSEGVLRRTAGERVGFFHQTFLEYTAARWLATREGEADKRAFLDRLGDDYLVSHPHAWPILRQLLAISDDAEFERLLAQLDLGELSAFRALALAAAARDDAGKALRSLVAAGLPPGPDHQRVLQEAIDSSPPRLLPATWDLLLALVREAEWPVAVNAVKTLGRLVAKRGLVLEARLGDALAAILRRPESPPGGSKELLGWICAACADAAAADDLDPQILSALRRVLANLGHASLIAVVRLHLRPGVALAELLELFVLVSSRPVPKDGTEPLVELTLRLLPSLLGKPPNGRWSDLPELLRADLPAGWHRVQAQVVGHQLPSHDELVSPLFAQLLSGTGGEIYRAQLALRTAIRSGGADVVRSSLLAIPASSLAPERARRLAGLLAELAARPGGGRDQDLLAWLEPVVRQDPENFVKSLAALAEGGAAASELVARLLAILPHADRMRLIRAVLRHGRRETALLLAESFERELAAAPADPRSRLALVSVLRVRAGTSSTALHGLFRMAGSQNEAAALAASTALVELAEEGVELGTADLLALLRSRFVGVRRHALDSLRALLRRGTAALSDADVLSSFRALEAETELPVLLGLGGLLSDWLRGAGRPTAELVERFLQMAERLLAERLGAGVARTLIILLKVMAQTAEREVVGRLQTSTLAILRSTDLHLVKDGESEMVDLLGALARADPGFLPRVATDPPSQVRNLRALVFAIKRVEGAGSELLARLASRPSCPPEIRQLLLSIRTGLTLPPAAAAGRGDPGEP